MSGPSQPANLPKAFPKTITAQQTADRLVITERASPPWLAMLILTVLAALTVWPLLLIAGIQDNRHPITSLLLASSGYVVIWYLMLVGTINRLEVIVTRDEISKRIWPIPVPGRRWSLKRSDLALIHGVHQSLKFAGSGDVYNLMARRNDGGELVIISNQGNPGTLTEIARLMEATLGPAEMDLYLLTSASTRAVSVSRETRRQTLRALRILLFVVGGLFLLASLAISVAKTAHILKMSRSPGVITGSQHHSHSLGRYSFYVTYQANGRRVHAYSFTDSVFDHADGKTVTVLYDPQNPNEPELLIFDLWWFLDSVLFFISAVAVGLGFWAGQRL